MILTNDNFIKHHSVWCYVGEDLDTVHSEKYLRLVVCQHDLLDDWCCVGEDGVGIEMFHIAKVANVKLCKPCGNTLDASEFWKDSSKSDGMHYCCKLCATVNRALR